MKVFVLALLTGFTLRAQHDVTPAVRDRIEKAVLEVNAQMSAASEALDIDRLFSYMMPNERGSIILNGVLYATREDALAAVKANARGGASVRYVWKSQMVTVISPTIALLVAKGETIVRTDNDPERAIITPFSQSILFLLRDGRWRALHAHQSAER